MSFTADLYARALDGGSAGLYLHPLEQLSGEAPVRLDVSRWRGPADEADDSVLQRCVGPVLDVGCGPGRLTAAAAERGLEALGVDVAPSAVLRTIEAGGAAVCRSVFAPLPDEGGWATVLLIDGNVGIGGDPNGLLRRCMQLVAPKGRIIVEVDPADVDRAYEAYLVDSDGRSGDPFPWARLGLPALRRRAKALGISCVARWHAGGRCFAELGLDPTSSSQIDDAAGVE